MKSHYELLGINPTADVEEVKRAFRREIARYHPDKVQHLGTEFQEIAATRAAALTEAYRVLMDAALRQRYDEDLSDGLAADPHLGPAPASAAPAPAPAHADPGSSGPVPPPVDRRFAREQASTTDFVRRAVAARLKEVVAAAGGTAITASTFDSVFQIKGRKTLFRKPEPTVRLAIRFVPLVDSAAIEDGWASALRLAVPDEMLCLMLLGSGMAPARELARAVSDLRRKTRKPGPIVIPVDVRDWEALLPPETPSTVRLLLERLRQGD